MSPILKGIGEREDLVDYYRANCTAGKDARRKSREWLRPEGYSVDDVPSRHDPGISWCSQEANSMLSTERDLADKVVLITGTGSAIGIGRATALAFGRAGALVAANDVIDEELTATVELLRSEGIDAEGYQADVADAAAVQTMVTAVVARFGRVDVLVNNAGIARKKAFVALSDHDWRQTLDVNLGGTKNCAQAVVPHMLAQERGSIVNVSSLMGSPWGWADHVHYSASKAGIEGLTRALAVELGPRGITVNAVAPGFIETAQSLSVEHSAGPEKMPLAIPLIPLRRIGGPQDIAGVVVFLASNAARYITGQVILVDGGLTLGDLSYLYGTAT
jgi:3-oxoacyl-[acyl-carrier protein] reductase